MTKETNNDCTRPDTDARPNRIFRSEFLAEFWDGGLRSGDLEPLPGRGLEQGARPFPGAGEKAQPAGAPRRLRGGSSEKEAATRSLLGSSEIAFDLFLHGSFHGSPPEMVWCFDSYNDQQTALRNVRASGYGGPVAEYNKAPNGKPCYQLELGLPWSAAYRWRLAFVTPEREQRLRELLEEKCNLQNKVDNFDVNWEQQQLIARELRKENDALKAKLKHYENKYGQEI